MEDILNRYKDKLDSVIGELKTKVKFENDVDKILEDVRNELSNWGKDNLKMMLSELKSYVENNNEGFIDNNEEKWKTILDKGEALSEYGLYVAPVDLLKESEIPTESIYIGTGAFVGSLLLTKLISKKAKILPSIIVSVLSGFAAYYAFKDVRTERVRESAINYIDDAYDWMSTAFENMYRIFKDAK